MKTLVIEIFRPGTHVPMSGTPLTFSEADIQGVAAGYDKSKHEAPVVLGHPKTDDPAMGWVQGLEFRDGGLYATCTDLEDAFAEAIEARRYDKRSPAFYAPDAKGNPTPGSWSLRHLGFLGAQVPGCKGLKPIAFAAGDEPVVFADAPMWTLSWALRSIADIFRHLRDKAIEKSSVEEADMLYPDYSIRALSDAAQGLQDAAPVPAFSEPDPADATAFAERTSQLDGREAELKKREDAITAHDKKLRDDADTAFVEGLVLAGKVAPGRKADVVTLLQSSDDVQAYAFGEVNETRKAYLKRLLTEKDPIISFAEIGGGEDPPAGDAESLAAAATVHIAEQAKKGINVSSAQAVRHVQKGTKA